MCETDSFSLAEPLRLAKDTLEDIFFYDGGREVTWWEGGNLYEQDSNVQVHPVASD